MLTDPILRSLTLTRFRYDRFSRSFGDSVFGDFMPGRRLQLLALFSDERLDAFLGALAGSNQALRGSLHAAQALLDISGYLGR